MTKKQKTIIGKFLLAGILAISGGVLIGDWKTVAGLFLLLWANNIDRSMVK